MVAVTKEVEKKKKMKILGVGRSNIGENTCDGSDHKCGVTVT